MLTGICLRPLSDPYFRSGVRQRIKFGRRSPLRPFILLSFIGAFLSCGSPGEEDRKPVARVGSETLYEDELRELIPIDMSGADSASIVRATIENWAREAVLLQKAEKNLAEMNDIDLKIRDYRRSLIIYAYEKALISQQLDTNVTGEEIERYYKEHPESFTLKDNIIKVTYVKVDKNATDLLKVRTWYRSDEEKDRQNLTAYCKKNDLQNFYLDDSWLLFDDLLKEIPIKLYDKESFLQYNRFVELSDSTNYYFVNIRGFRIKNTLSPLSFETENIRHVLLNKRKLDLIAGIKNDLYNEALNNEQVEIYK